MSSPILVGLALREDDAAPLALARQLAELTGAPLALATALPHESFPPVPVPEYAAALREEARAQLEQLSADIDVDAVSVYAGHGSPSGVLHELAEQTGAAAIVVGSTHRGAVGRVLVGDVAAGLIHGAPCPVVVAPREYAPRPWERIGVAYGGTPEANEALDAAVAIAKQTGAAVSAFTVLEPTDVAPVYPVPGWVPSPDDDSRRLEHAQRTAESALGALPPGVRGTAEVLHGKVVPALAGASEELDVLVCGSRGYGALRSVMAGGVSRGLAHSAACPLLIVPRKLEQPLWRRLIEHRDESEHGDASWVAGMCS